MATYQIPPVEPFDFSKPEEWPKWIRRFERFRVASELSGKSEESQVNTLVYSMGDKSDDILQAFNLSAEDAKNYATVKGKFEAHFVKRRNTIYERAKFNQRTQAEGETVDSFITDLYCLAAHCQYGVLYDEMVRDRIVVGIRDRRLSEKLQMQATLLLDEAVTQVRQSEAVKKQQLTVRSEGQGDTTIEIVKGYRFPRKGMSGDNYSSQKCTRCGRTPGHSRVNCPAREPQVPKERPLSKDVPNEEYNNGHRRGLRR